MRATEFTTEETKSSKPEDYNRATNFIRLMHDKFPDHPKNPIAFIMQYEGGSATVVLGGMPGKTDIVYIDYIQASPPQAGIGKRALADLQKMAAEANVRLKLQADAKFGTPKSTLAKFYRDAGFKQHGDNFSWKPQ